MSLDNEEEVVLRAVQSAWYLAAKESILSLKSTNDLLTISTSRFRYTLISSGSFSQLSTGSIS